MALLFVDGFDHYAFADKLTKWTSLVSSNQGSMATGRFGTGQLALVGAGATQNCGWIKQNLVGTNATWVVGFAWQATIFGANTVVRLFDTGGTAHLELRTVAGGQITVCRNGTVLATSATVFATNTWYYLELKGLIDDAGSYEFRVDGVTNLSGSADTRNAGVTNCGGLCIGSTSGGQNHQRFDDLYLLDGAGSAPNNDFLGDVRVTAIMPSGDGNSSQWVGSDGNSVNNSLLVDETTPATADYVESSVVGDKDTYAFGDIASSGTVYGVQFAPYAAKTDAGSRSIVSVARLSGTETDGSVKALSVSPGYLLDIRETKPGGGAWTASDINSAEFGIKVNA